MNVACQTFNVTDRAPPVQAPPPPPPAPTIPKIALPLPPAAITPPVGASDVALPQVERQPTTPSDPPALPLPGDGREMDRVGLLLPLTGPEGPLGQAMLRAAQMAVFDIADDSFLLPR